MHRAAAPILALALAGAPYLAPPHPGPASGPARAPAPGLAPPLPGVYAWPLRGPVLRPFEPPAGPYAAGHRGIDIGAPEGSAVRASERGAVAFAGPVAGSLFVSIDHPGGVRTTYSWLSERLVRRGDPVTRGQVIGRSGPGHPAGGPPHLHFAALVGGVYVDPLLLLEPLGVVGLVRLAPLEEPR